MNGGSLVVGANGALGSGTLAVNNSASLDAGTAVTLGNAVNLCSGVALTVGQQCADPGRHRVRQWQPDQERHRHADTGRRQHLQRWHHHQRRHAGRAWAAGDLTLGNAGAGFDISGATGNQTIGALNGVLGTTLALGAIR